jgi:uncharacterized OB-fold protein
MRIDDWTRGVECLTYQRCLVCNRRWYFVRLVCPHCGSNSLAQAASCGEGEVYATTLVHRAPSPDWRDYVPYLIVLVDMREGFRTMGHARGDIHISETVRLHWMRMASILVPVFERTSQQFVA